MSRSLKQGGIFYASFKHGTTERQEDGRHFTDLDQDILKTIVKQINNLKLDKTWITDDVSKEKTEEWEWLNALMTKLKEQHN